MTSTILSPQVRADKALRETDSEVFVSMLQRVLKSGVTAQGFVYGDPVAASGDTSTLNVSVDRDLSPVEHWQYTDSVQLTYKRIPLTAVTNRYGNVLRADLPTTVREVVKDYLLGLGFHDRSAQFTDANITTYGNETVTVGEGSLLLHGSAPFTVRPLQRQLSTVLSNTTVAGFKVPTDFTTGPEELLYSQLEAANTDTLPYPLESDKTSIGTLEVVSGYRDDNTRATITATGDGYYLGSVQVIYTRVDLGWYSNGEQYLVDGPRTPNLSDILDNLSTQIGLPLTITDVRPQNFTQLPVGSVTTLTIPFTEDNLRYVGEITVDYRVS